MVSGEFGVPGAHVTQTLVTRKGQGPVIIQLLKMEGPRVLDHHLQQINERLERNIIFAK